MTAVIPPDLEPMDSLAWQAWADMLEEDGEEKRARRARVTANALARHAAGDTLILGRSNLREAIIRYNFKYKRLHVHHWPMVVIPGIMTFGVKAVIATGPSVHAHAIPMSGDVITVRHGHDTLLPLAIEPGMGLFLDHPQNTPPRDCHVILHPSDLYRIKE